MSVNRRPARLCIFALLALSGLLSGRLTQAETTRHWTEQLSSPLPDPLNSLPLAQDPNCLIQPATEVVPLRLEEAMHSAHCNHPQALSALASIHLYAAQLGEARSAFLPTLEIGLSRVRQKSQRQMRQLNLHSEQQNESRFARLNWRLFDFGGRQASHRAAQSMLQTAKDNFQATSQQLMQTVVQSFYESASAQALLNSKMGALERAEQALRSARRGEALGASSQTDTLQATFALARSQLEHNRAARTDELAYLTLQSAMGTIAGTPRRPLDVALELDVSNLSGHPSASTHGLPDHVSQDPAESKQNLQSWLGRARRQHPAIAAAKSYLEAANQQVAASRSEGLPALDLSHSKYFNGRPGQTASGEPSEESVTALTLSFRLFDGFARTYKNRAAQAQVETREAALEIARSQVLAEVAKSHAEAQTATQNLASTQTMLQAAAQSLESAQRKLSAGVLDLRQLLDAQNTVAEARQERIQAVAEWHSARLRLLASAGQLDRAALSAPTSTVNNQPLTIGNQELAISH